MLLSSPATDAERDALKFLQRFIRGLDMSKLIQFLRFTTAMDIIVGKKLEVTIVSYIAIKMLFILTFSFTLIRLLL